MHALGTHYICKTEQPHILSRLVTRTVGQLLKGISHKTFKDDGYNTEIIHDIAYL